MSEKTEKAPLPESPISLNTKVKSPNGFEYQLTLRSGVTEEDFADLMDMVIKKEERLLLKNWSPLPYLNSYKGGGAGARQPNYVEGRKCPECGEKLIHTQKKDGTRFVKCSTNKWDAAANRATGCSFVEWPDKPRPAYNRTPPNDIDTFGY